MDNVESGTDEIEHEIVHNYDDDKDDDIKNVKENDVNNNNLEEDEVDEE